MTINQENTNVIYEEYDGTGIEPLADFQRLSPGEDLIQIIELVLIQFPPYLFVRYLIWKAALRINKGRDDSFFGIIMAMDLREETQAVAA